MSDEIDFETSFAPYLEPWKAFNEEVIYQTNVSERKGKKDKERVIVIGKYRFWICENIKKKGLRLLSHFHYYSVSSITNEENDLVIKVKNDGKEETFTFVSPNIELILANFKSQIDLITSGFPEDFIKIDSNQKNSENLSDYEEFLQIYYAYCSFLVKFPNNYVVQYIQLLYSSNNKTLDLTVVPSISETSNTQDFSPLICSLKYNTFFRDLIITDMRIDYLIPSLISLIRTNTTLTRLVLSNTSLTESHFINICEAIKDNTNNSIQNLDFSMNKFDLKGSQALVHLIKSFHHSLFALDISKCQISSKGIEMIINALAENPVVSLALQTLCIGGNKIEELGSNSIENFCKEFKTYSQIRNLDLSYGNINIGITKTIRLLTKLKDLNLSGSKIDDIYVLEKLIEGTSLECLNLSNCTLADGALKSLFSAISKNDKIDSLKLNLSGITESRSTLNLVLSDLSPKLGTFDISDYSVKDGLLPELLDAICKQTNLVELKMNDVFGKISPTNFKPIFERLLNILSLPKLKSLSIAKSNKTLILSLLENFPSNHHITYLNIEKCGLGDAGANHLAELLKKDNVLEQIEFDENEVKFNGFLTLAISLKDNKTLNHLTFSKDFFNTLSEVKAFTTQGKKLISTQEFILVSLSKQNKEPFVPWISSANNRISTGLPLLDTVLPLSELPEFLGGKGEGRIPTLDSNTAGSDPQSSCPPPLPPRDSE